MSSWEEAGLQRSHGPALLTYLPLFGQGLRPQGP